MINDSAMNHKEFEMLNRLLEKPKIVWKGWLYFQKILSIIETWNCHYECKSIW